MTLEDRTPEAAVAHIGDAGRHAQAFPTLTPREIDRIRRFGTVRRISDRTAMLETGKPSPGMFVLLSGHVAISQHDGLGHVTPVVEQGAGQFMAEVGTLSGGPALFLFCGADPATAWLTDCGVALDGHGFVVTGAPLGNAAAPPLQSSVRGVFAVGDVRSGSVKRVGAAIGEGANVVPFLHACLAAHPLPAPTEPADVENLHAS